MSDIEIGIIAAATVAGPILAVQAQKWIERAGERQRARRRIFHALMSNRATRLHDDFIRSLNLIDLEFSPKTFGGAKDRAVIDAWRSLFGEYSNHPPDGTSEDGVRAWSERVNDRLVSLLFAMSKAVGYDFSEEQLRRGIYYPIGRAELEQTQLSILKSVRQIVEGNAALPMKVTEAPGSPELLKAQIDLTQKSAAAYEDNAFRIRMIETKKP